jgi:hypothetical protein
MLALISRDGHHIYPAQWRFTPPGCAARFRGSHPGFLGRRKDDGATIGYRGVGLADLDVRRLSCRERACPIFVVAALYRTEINDLWNNNRKIQARGGFRAAGWTRLKPRFGPSSSRCESRSKNSTKTKSR